MGLNRIYKVIWSKTKGCYVVVSEMAKRVGRNKAKAIVISTAAMSMAVAVAPTVMNVDRVEASVLIGAADGTTISANKSTVSSNGITIGGAITKAGDESVHIGDSSGSVGSRNVVIGMNASAGYDEKNSAGNPPKDGAFNQSVAIGAGRAAGEGARAYGDQSIAIGSNTIARGNSSIAIGNDDVDKTDTIKTTYTDLEGNTKEDTIGNAYKALTGQSLGPKVYQDTTSKEAAVAIGVKAVAGDISLALGTGANADRVNAVAIGSGATATRDNAVAIGGGATTEAPGTKEVKATINGLKFTWAGGDNTLAGDVVSFGKKDYERQLKHVAAGNVSENSTDAINGSQFYGVLKHLTADPVYFYGADDSTAGKIEGVEAAEKSADALKKKVVAKSMADSRLNLLGGADKEKLSDNNIGVTYENTSSIRFRLSKELAGLTSAEFKNTAGDITTINGDGVTITPVANGKKPVSVTKNGLNNGGNVIANVAGNLEGAKPNSAEPTTNATAPNNASTIKNNAATVGDVLQAGWNLQNNSEEKDFVKPYDTVDFVDGNGTTAVVDTTDNRTSTVKYDVNLGNGLEKNSANKITIKPADKSLEVNKNGVKVKTDGTTITTDPTNGLKVVTGGIEDGTTPGTVKVTDGDNDKIATVDSVVNAVNSAAFTLKASAIEGGTRNTGSTVSTKGEPIKAGSTIEMIAGKNLEVTHNKSGKITFATVDNPSFSTIQVGDSEGPKFSATADGNIRVSDKDDTNPVKITNVKDGEISKTSKDAINGSQFHAVAKNTIKLAGQNGTDTATETAGQELDKKGGIKFTVKSSDGKLLDITADANGDTITITPKTGTITTTGGVPTAVTTNGKLVTVDEVVNALKDLGWKATAGTDGTGTMIGTGAAEELIKAGDTVTFKAGNNLSIKQDGKNFIYSLNPALTGLTSAEFKDGDNKVKITPTGITITKPAGTTENTVTLNQNGLNNGGNPITNVAGNLQGAKAGTDAPTTSATAPTLGTGADEVNKNNAATVGDVLNAGWNLQEKGVAKDFVKPYDTVNFIDGDGTSVAVATTNDGRTSTVKYSVNLGNGLEKTTDNKITVTPADKSLEVTTAGLKAKTDNTTITTGDSGLKVVTGGIEAGTTPGTMKVTNGDTGKIATVDSVVDAVNNAAFTLKASATTDGTRNTGSTVDANGESIKAGNTIEMIAGKNLNVTHNTNGKIIFATVENPSFNTVQIGNSKGPRFSATSDGNIKVSDKDDTKPVKITNVADGTISDTSKDAINGSQIHKLVNKAIKLAGQNGSETAGETDPQNLTQQDPIKFTVKSSDGSLLQVEAAGSTITLTPKTGTITTGEDGIPTANTTGGKLVTADNLVKALTEMGWKATAGTDGTGTMIGAGATEELIKSGNTVTFKAGDNLAIKQDSKNFIYSLKTDLTGLTSAEFKDGNNNAVKITPNGVSFKKPNATDADTVTLNQNGLNNGGNPITNVAGNLQGAKAGTDAPTTNATAPSLGTGTDQVNKNNAATVGDVLNAGWNLQEKGVAKDFVKPYDTVNFMDGDGTSVAVATANDGTTSTVKYSVNTGDGLEKNKDNKITVKAADKSLEVTDAGVAVKKADKSLEVTDDGLKVKTDNTTIKTGDTGLTVNTGTINKVTEGNTAGTVVAKTGDENKIATVSNVVEAINNAAWTATSAATSAGELGATATNQLVKAGDKVTFEADKNIKITQAGSKFTFTTRDDVSFNTVQIGGNQGPKFSKTDAGDIKVSGSDNATPVKITNVQDGDISADSKDAINGSQFHAVAKNKIKLAGQNGTSAATETDEQELDKKGGIKFTVKSSDGTLLDVAAKGDTITLTPKTATITTGKDGVPTANTDDGKLVTADQLVTALKEMGWKATAGQDGTGTVDGNAEELIKAGNIVTFKAGDNLSIKQEGKNFIYSLKTELTGLTSAEFKDGKNNKVNITPEGITITKPADPTAGTPENTVTLNQNGLNNGGNPITNVTSNLVNYSDPVVNGKAPVRNELRKFDNNAVPNTNVATVGDLRNMGWVVSSNKTTDDLGNPYSETVKNADEVKFVGTGLATVSGKTENGVRTITVDVESKTAINAVTYTKTDGTKVYPVEGPNGTTYHTTPEGKGQNDETVDGSNVITSVNGPKGTKTPSTLTNVAGNLDGAKAGTDAPTTKHDAPNTTEAGQPNYVNTHNAATVGDVLQAGWNLQNNSVEKDFVKPYDTVNFADGNGTTAVVDTTDNKVSTVKYNVNTGNGLEKTTDNKITVKPADKSLDVTEAGVAVKKADQSLEVTDDGLKVKVDGTTIKTGDTGLTVNTGTINKVTEGNTAGTVVAKTGDENKIATVSNVVEAINNAAWTATSAATTAGELGAAATNQLVKAGDKVTFEADKNIKITQNGSKFTFATKDNVTFETVQVGGDQGPKFSKSAAGDIKVSGSDNTTPVKITNVKDGEISETSTDAINGSQFHKLANNTITLQGQTGDAEKSSTKAQNLDAKDGIKFTVKSSNGDLLEVTAAEDTITITPKTGTITTGANGIPTANTDGGKLVTADQLVTALTEMGWKATAGTEGTGTMIGAGATEELIKAGNTVTFKAGDNLSIKQDGKNFIYSLNPALTGLTSAEFKEGDNKVKITPTGITITKPADPTAGTPENTVTLNQNGLNNGGNPITNVGGNLDGAKAGTDAPTTKHDAPNTTEAGQPNYVNTHNAATVGDVLQAGWNLQNNSVEKDFVKPYDTVNFADGNGTTAVVDTTDNKVSTVKYNVNTGNGLEKTTDNKITVKPADKSLDVTEAGVAVKKADQSLEVTDDGLKVKADGTTIKTGDTGLTVNTGEINKVETGDTAGTVTAKTGDEHKIATVGNVVEAINNAAWTATSAATAAGELGANATNQLVKAGDKVTFEADKNIKITQAGSQFTFATKDNVSFETVQVGGDQGPKFSKSAAGDIKVSGSDNTTPVKITNVKDGEISETSTDAINGSQFHKLANNTITLQGQTGDAEKSSTKAQNLDAKDGIKFTVKSSNGDLLEVTAAEDTITITPKTGTITTGANGIPTANTDGGKLVTADQLVTALTEMGWKATAGTEGTGTIIGAGATEELIKAGNTVTFKAGDNLSIKQDGKNFIYSLNPALTGLTSAEFKDGKNNKVNITPEGITITKPADPTANTPENTVTLNQNGLNNGGNPITNVGGNLDGAKAGTDAPTTKHDAPNTTEAGQPNYVNTHNAATVGDVLQAGWNLQNNGAAKDFVKPYDTVNFVNGLNTTAVVSTVDGTTSHVTYNVTGLPVTYTTADGTPVSKIGDKFYKVNDKGQPIDEQGNPSTKVNNNGEPIDGNGNVINAIDTAANLLKTSLVNPAPEANKTGTTSPTTLDNVTSKLANYSDPDVNGKAPVRNNLVDLSKPENGQPNVSDNTVATVGDLRNMGWIVSSDKTTGETDKAYTDTVKNANEVKFVGEGTAIVSGKTDNKGVRTITVKVDDQTSTNNSVTPIVYTKADGTQVYPTNKKDDQGHPIFNTKADGSGDEVPGTDVVTSVNGPNGTKGDKAPTTLKNVKNNIPNVNDGSKTITNPDGTEKAGDVENINKAPLTAEDAAKLSNPKTADGAANPNYIGNNAATVSDVLNAGWNLQNNGTAKDFVKPYDTVNFINGLGTTAVVTTREGNTTSDVTFNVKAANGSVTVDEDGVKVTTGEMKPAVDANQKETGAIATPVDPTMAKQLKDTLDAAVKELATAKDALKTAETALAAKPNDPALQKDVEDKKAQVAEKQTPVNDAQKAHDKAGLNKVATVQNVAEAINNSGFNLKTSADGGEKLTGTKDDGELIKPSNTVEMVAGNNLTVKQDEHGKITYATKDDVTFKTVDTGTLNVGSPTTYTDGKGNTYTKVGENYYKPADVENGVPKQGATPVDVTTPVTPVSPVTMKAEAAKPATNNVTDAQPSSALNITSKDGKPTQITGVGSTLNTKTVDTTPTGTAPGTTPNTTPTNLVDLEGTKDAPVNKNAAATVGDLQNMGWVVSTKDGNGYKDVVKNANVVDFKGDQGVTVTGKTLADGTREITVGIKEGEVTNKVTITHGDGSKTDAVKIGDNYYKVDKDGKPIGFDKDENGKPAGTPLKVDPNTDKVTNAGAGVVTGNAVANAIQDSGWNVGIGSTDKDFSKDAKVYDKVNPNDDVKFANGANTNVSMVTVDALNEDGTKKATTYVKVDINRDLKIDSVTTGGTATDKNGNNLVKVGDQYYKEGDVTIVTNPDGTTTVTPKENAKAVPPADVIPAKDGAMIVKNADGKDVVSATVGKDGNGAFGINGKDGKNGISMTAKDGQGTIGVNGKDGKSTTIAGDTITIKDKDNNATNIGVNTITLVDKAGNTTTTTADKSEIKDAAGNINTNTATGNTLKDPNGNTHTSTASTSELKDKDGNTNTSTPTTNVLKDTNGNTNTSAATGTTYKDKDENKTVVGPKEINISDKSGENTASLTNKDLLLNAKDPNTGVDKTSHVSGDKIAFTTTDEMEKVVDKDGKPVIDPATGKQKEVVKMEKVFDKDGKPVIDPATGKQKEVVKNPGNSTEYTNEGLKVIPNSTVARDVNGNPTFLDKDGKPVMKDTDGKYKYVGQDGKPGDKYDGSVGVLKPNVVDNTRVISFGMDKPVLDKNGKPVTGPDGNPVMTEGISAGMQQIHNVAPGTKDTDGVNVSQLRGTTININNRMNRMGAQAAALAGLQSIQYDPLEPTQISAGLGHYKGSSALALGVNHFKNESTMFHMGASYNGHGDETMMNASVTWKFGARADETAVKDTFRQGPISSAYTLQDKVSALEAQNKIQKDQLEELKALNEKQQEQIAELFKRLIEKA